MGEQHSQSAKGEGTGAEKTWGAGSHQEGQCIEKNSGDGVD